MVKGIFLLLIAVYCNMANACKCGFLYLDTPAARSTQQIFIFRLVSAQVSASPPDRLGHSEVIARIKIVSQLRGVSNHVSELSFSTQRCCGTRLDVGGYFVAFLPPTGTRFAANNGNVVEIDPFDLENKQAKINAVLAGKLRFEDVFSRGDIDRTEQELVPAPPCPLSRGGKTAS